MNSRTLTVTAMAALVVALLLPVLSGQRELMRRARCLDNLRRVGAAMQLYANDHDGWLPAISELVDGSRGELENGFNHHAALLLNGNYGLGPAAFVCPSDREDGDPLQPFSDDGLTGHAPVSVADGGPPWQADANLHWYNISYLYVAGFTLGDRGDFLLLADEHWTSEGDCPAECRHDLDPFDNHGRAGRNVLFLDGHGEWLPGVRIDPAFESIRDHAADTRTRTVD